MLYAHMLILILASPCLQVMRYLFHYFLPENARAGESAALEPELSAGVGGPGPLLAAWRERTLAACQRSTTAPASSRVQHQHQEQKQAQAQACFGPAIRQAVQEGLLLGTGAGVGAGGASAASASVCSPPAGAAAAAAAAAAGRGLAGRLAHSVAVFVSMSASWWREGGGGVCEDIDHLHRAYLEASATHALFDQLRLLPSLPPQPVAESEELLLSAVRNRANFLYADFLSSCLSFSRWSCCLSLRT